MKKQQDSQKITLIIPRQLLERLRTIAYEHRRSLNSEIVWALEHYISEENISPCKEL